MQGNGIADHADGNMCRALHQHRRDDIGRGHGAVEIGVVFIDTNAIETVLFGRHQLVDVFVVEQASTLWVVVFVGQ